MAVEIKLPQLGESTYEGTIGRWLKQPGDHVERFEPLVEIVTDKVNVEMPSPMGGVLKEILVPEGETKTVGTPIALMEEEGAASAQPAKTAPRDTGASAGPAGPSTAPSATPSVGPPGPGPDGKKPGVRLSPLVKRLAEEHGVPLEEVERLQGSGAGGRITKEDLLKHVASRKAGPTIEERYEPDWGAAAPSGGARPDAQPPSQAPVQPIRPSPQPAAGPGDQLLKLSPLRRTTAQRMAQSKREIPHAYGVIEVDMTAIVRWREAHKEEWRRRHGVNLTYTAFFVRAAADALRAFPIVNAAWTEDGILQRGAVHIGLGIALEDGLTVAVIRDTDQKSLAGLARDLDALGGRARDGKLTLDDVRGGTFTITNPGIFGSIWSMPVILPGQAAILATDAIVKRPVVRDDAIAIRSILHLGLSFDHRVFDGAVALRFLNHMKTRLEGFRPGDLGTDT